MLYHLNEGLIFSPKGVNNKGISLLGSISWDVSSIFSKDNDIRNKNIMISNFIFFFYWFFFILNFY